MNRKDTLRKLEHRLSALLRQGGRFNGDDAEFDLLDTEYHDAEEAAWRLEHGQYGVCIDCNKSIPVARLKARPQAIRCIGCQREFESQRSRAGSRRSAFNRIFWSMEDEIDGNY